ncbi:MAG: hypothetical protein QOF51_913 [Chloroflexota bacterium]|jgi:response regulator RpfG family c-di-GMP phosphodiesterase|nr:hypothetical protein [Chloroflexota bacterium]
MEGHAQATILMVDDEPNLLAGLTRILGRHFKVTTAVGGPAGLEAIERAGPFEVVVSDMRMPGMDGATFLGHVRRMTPDTTRMLLTGQTDIQSAIAAVNEGQIFRFLSKPCDSTVLVKSLEAAAEQYRLVTSERVLLEQTLLGSIKALTEVMALADPLAFGRATRAQQYVSQLADGLESKDRWQLDVAAMLSQIACITLPRETQAKVYYGRALTDGEQVLVDRLPAVASKLLANIPRLEPVRQILTYREKRFDGSGQPRDSVRGEQIPWGARVLKIVLDFDVLQSQGLSAQVAMDALRGRLGWYDREILETFAALRGATARSNEVREISIREVSSGMVFVDDVKTTSGTLLIARGHEISPELLERIRNLSRNTEIAEPVLVEIKRPPTNNVLPRRDHPSEELVPTRSASGR